MSVQDYVVLGGVLIAAFFLVFWQRQSARNRRKQERMDSEEKH